MCTYRHDTNLRVPLVRSHLNNISASDEDCGRSQCNTCTHTNASPTINTPGGCITINSKYTCIGQNVVYIIKYRTCQKIYIGEKGRRLGDCFREHLRSTRQINTDLPVGRHFTSPRHACTDMLVSVIRSGFCDTQDRRQEDLIPTLPSYKHPKFIRTSNIGIVFDLSVYMCAHFGLCAQITSKSNFFTVAFFHC